MSTTICPTCGKNKSAKFYTLKFKDKAYCHDPFHGTGKLEATPTPEADPVIGSDLADGMLTEMRGHVEAEGTLIVTGFDQTAPAPQAQPAAPAGEEPIYREEYPMVRSAITDWSKHAPTPPTGTPELELHHRITELRRQRELHLMDESDYTQAILDMIKEELADQAKAYDARFEAAVGGQGLTNLDNIARIRARWYGPEQGGGDGK